MLPLLKFRTIFKSTVWGGRRIAEFKGIPSQGDNIGESWEISPLHNAESVVAEGALKGMTIGQLTAQFPNELLGKKVKDTFGSKFPLLIKFIDSNSDLSIQVHPDNEYAARKYGDKTTGKTEFWYALSPKEGAFVYSGFSEPTSPFSLRERINNHTITDILSRYDVEPGDVFYLPAGRVHAIGAGNLLIEIQQASDITYRLYDYNRRDTNGNLRELHIEDAICAIHYDDCLKPHLPSSYKQNPHSKIIDSDYFSCHIRKLEGVDNFNLSERDSFTILIAISGALKVTTQESSTTLRRGETLLIPAEINDITLAGDSELLVIYI